MTGEIRAFECYREAWQVIRPQFGMILIISLVGMLIGGAFSIVMGAMLCAFILCSLSTRRATASFERLFKGFQFFLPAFLVWLLLFYRRGDDRDRVHSDGGTSDLFSRNGRRRGDAFRHRCSFRRDRVCDLMVCFHTLLLFSFPLIVDKRLSALKAVKLSAKAVWQNLSGVASLFGVGFLVSLAGMLLFCVGVYLTIPLILASTVVAYRKVFPGQLQTALPRPPPPSSYQGL